MSINEVSNPTNLVAVIVAAKKAGNKELERLAKQQLSEMFDIRLVFGRDFDMKQPRAGV